jgi:hypothetical protein
MGAWFADFTIFDKVSDVTSSKSNRGKERKRHTCDPRFESFCDSYVSANIGVQTKRTHDNLCATANVVRPFAAWSRASCTTFSELESSAEVASSKSRTLGFLKSARAIAIRSVTANYGHTRIKQSKRTHAFDLPRAESLFRLLLFRSPCRCGQSGYTKEKKAENIYWGNDRINSRILASLQAASISSWVTSDSGLVAPSKTLNLIVPAYKVYNNSAAGSRGQWS